MVKILLFLFSGLLSTEGETGSGTLSVRVSNLESSQGCLRLAVYDRDNFLKKDKAISAKTVYLERTGKRRVVEMPDLAFGSYALAIYHDINNNGKLDTNFMGIPAEPYAFSNNPGVKWRSPNYDETSFEFSRDQQIIEVTMQRWRER